MDECVLLYHHLSLMMTSPATPPPPSYSVLPQEPSLISQQLLALSLFNHNSNSVSKCVNKWQQQQSITIAELRGKQHIWWGVETTQCNNILLIRSIFLTGAVFQTVNPLTQLLKISSPCFVIQWHLIDFASNWWKSLPSDKLQRRCQFIITECGKRTD